MQGYRQFAEMSGVGCGGKGASLGTCQPLSAALPEPLSRRVSAYVVRKHACMHVLVSMFCFLGVHEGWMRGAGVVLGVCHALLPLISGITCLEAQPASSWHQDSTLGYVSGNL